MTRERTGRAVGVDGEAVLAVSLDETLHEQAVPCIESRIVVAPQEASEADTRFGLIAILHFFDGIMSARSASTSSFFVFSLNSVP